MIKDIQLLWEECDGLDHVPIQVTLDAKGFQGTHQALSPGTSINVEDLIPLDEAQANKLYQIVNCQCDHEVQTLYATDDLDIAHHTWSKIAETFLHTWAALQATDDIGDCAAPIASRIIQFDRKKSLKSQGIYKNAYLITPQRHMREDN